MKQKIVGVLLVAFLMATSSWGQFASNRASARPDGRVQEMLDNIEDITIEIDNENNTSSLEMNVCVTLEAYLSMLWELYHLKGQVDAIGTLGFEIAGNGAWGYLEADAFLELLIDLGIVLDINASLCIEVPIVTVGDPIASGTSGLVATDTLGYVGQSQNLTLEEELTALAAEIRSSGLSIGSRIPGVLDDLGMSPDDIGDALALLNDDVHTLVSDPLDLLDVDRFEERLGVLPIVSEATGVVDALVNQAQDDPCELLAGLPAPIADAVQETCGFARDGIETMEDLVGAIDSLQEIEALIRSGIAITVGQIESLVNTVRTVARRVETKISDILSAAEDAVDIIDCLEDPLSC